MWSKKTRIAAKQNKNSKEHSAENKAIETLPEHNPHVAHRQLERRSCLLQAWYRRCPTKHLSAFVSKGLTRQHLSCYSTHTSPARGCQQPPVCYCTGSTLFIGVQTPVLAICQWSYEDLRTTSHQSRTQNRPKKIQRLLQIPWMLFAVYIVMPVKSHVTVLQVDFNLAGKWHLY